MTDEVERLKAELRDERRKNFRDGITRRLLATGLDADYVAVQVQRALERTREKDSGALYVDVLGSRYSGDEAIEALADEIAMDAPDKWKTATEVPPKDGKAGKSPAATLNIKPKTDEEVREAQRREIGYARP